MLEKHTKAVTKDNLKRTVNSNALFIANLMKKFLSFRASSLEERIYREAKSIMLIRSIFEKRTTLDRSAKTNLCNFLRLIYPKRALENNCEDYLESIKRV